MARGGDFGLCGVEAMIVSRDVKSSERGEDVFFIPVLRFGLFKYKMCSLGFMSASSTIQFG